MARESNRENQYIENQDKENNDIESYDINDRNAFNQDLEGICLKML